MEYFPLAMYRENLDNIPEYNLPEGFNLRLFEDNDEMNWAQIETAVGEFSDINKALDRFKNEFSNHLEEMKKRCIFLLSPGFEPIGTVTAWFGDFAGEKKGRIHWVAIKPEYQGKGLAKPMFSAAMNILVKYHHDAYLTTQTTSWRAVNMYLHYNFKPVPRFSDDPDFINGWETIYTRLNKPGINI